ncbi:hypothetical protein A3A76_04530, partial [Candidatus Woesebacteria bacterium RIFCSPLOWO2_01_FULL_39_23]
MNYLPNKTYLTIHEAAAFLKVSTKTLRRWEKSGLLLAQRTSGGHRRYDIYSLDFFKKSKKELKTKLLLRELNSKLQKVKSSDIESNTVKTINYQEEYYPELPPFPVRSKKILFGSLISFTILVLGFAIIQSNFTNHQLLSIISKSPIYTKILAYKNTLQKSGNNAENSSKLGKIDSTSLTNVLADTTAFNAQTFNVYVDTNLLKNVDIGENLSVTGTATINNNLLAKGTTNDIAGTLNLSGNTLTSSADLTINPTGGGTKIGTGTPGSVDLTGSDLYITGDLEVDGTSYLPTINSSTITTTSLTGSTVTTSTLTINSESFTDLTGTGLQLSGGALQTTLGTAIDTSEITDATLLEADLNASNTPTADQILTYNSTTGGFTWATVSFTDTRGVDTVQESDVTINSVTATTIDFLGGDFDLLESPSGEINIQLAPILATVVGVAGNFDAGGTLTSGTGDAFQVTSSGTITIPGSEDITFGTIGLNDIGVSNITSGASRVGVYYSELANSTGTNVQDVLDDLDAAIGAGSSKWSQQTGFIYLSQTTDDVVIGGSTIAGGSLYFDESSANLYLGTNEAQNGILTLYSSGVGVTDPTITTDSSGNLIATSPNFNTTSTGINTTAIGATTPGTAAFTTLSTTGATTLGNNSSTVAVNSSVWDITTLGVASGFTGISSSGTITFSGLTIDGPVLTSGGILSSEAQLAIARGGTGGSTAPTSGQLLIGNAGNGYTVATLTDGTGISITEGSGSITIANSGVTSITGTANQVIASGATGAVTLSTPQDIATTSTPTFASMTLSAATNQLTLGTTNTTTINSVAPSASRVYTLPDFGSNDTFVGLAATQTLTNKTFTDNVTYIQDNLDNTKKLQLDLSNIGASTTTTLSLPAGVGASDTVCLYTTGNCVGLGGGVTTPGGTTNTLAKFTGASTIGDASITDTGSLVTLSTDVDFSLAGSENVTLSNSSLSSDLLSLSATIADTNSADLVQLVVTDNTATSGTGRGLYIEVGDGSASLDSAIAINHTDTTQVLTTGINITGDTSTAITTGINVSDPEIVTALAAGLNDLTGTNWSITGASGNMTGGTYNSQTISSAASFTGTVQVATSVTAPTYTGTGAVTLSSGGGNTLTLDSSSGSVIIASGDALQVNSGSVTSNNSAITIDSGSSNQVNIGSSDALSNGTWTISGAGAVSGVTTINASGSITAATAETINGIDISSGTVSDVVNLTINAGGDLTIGTIGLNDVGTSNLDSGASLVGVFDEFTYSSATTVQDVLDDLDAAIAAGTSKWTDAGAFTYLTNDTDDLVLGGTTVAGASLYFDESTANLYLGTNEALNGSLTLYSSGVGVTDALMSTDASANLLITSNNLSTTTTGINSTAIGATNASTGAFTTLSSTGVSTIGNGSTTVAVDSSSWDITAPGVASGLTGITSSGSITFSGLSSAGIVHNSAAGLLSTSAVNLAGGSSEITGILPVGNGGTGLDASTITNGQLLIGNDTNNNFDLATLTTGDGLGIINGAGSISLAIDHLDSADGTGVGVSYSGLEFQGSGNDELTLLQGCTADQILKWDDTNSQWECAGDEGSGTGSSKWTESGGLLYPNNYATVDLAIGANALAAPFSVDVSDNIVRIGDGGNDAFDPTINFYASDATDTGSLSYLDTDRFSFSGGDVAIGQTLILSTGASAGVSGGGLVDCDGTTQKLVWDDTTEEFACGTDQGSGAGGSKWTAGSLATYLTAGDTDLSVGTGTDTLTAPFSIDVSANRIRIGDAANDANTPGIDFYASDAADSGSLTYTDSDQFDFTLGDVVIDQKLILPSYSITANGSRVAQTTSFDSTASSQALYGVNLDITNNPTTNSNTGYGYYVTLNDAGSLANTVYGGYFDTTTVNTNDSTYGLAAQGDKADILLLGGKINSNNVAITIDAGSANSITLGAGDNLNLSGNFAQTGAGTLSTGTGAVSINGNTTFATGTTITQNGTGQVSFGGNVDTTNGLDVTGANLTVGGSNFSVAPGTGNTLISGTLGVTGLITASGGVTLPANQNLTLQSGTGTYSQTYSNTTGTAATINATNTSASGTSTLNAETVALTGTVTTGANTLNGLNFSNVTDLSNNTFNTINIGTGYDNFLVYNNAGFTGSLRGAALSDNRIYTLPNESGTICLDSNNCTFVSSFDVAAETGSNQTITTGDTLYINAGTGIDTVASATDIITVSVQSNSLDFAQFQDTLDLDAALTLNQGTNTWQQNYSGVATAQTLSLSDTGTGLNITSSSTGTLLNLTSTGTGTTPTALSISNTSSGAITTAIDVSDAEIVTALAVGSNDVTVGGATISSSEFAILDSNISLTTEVTGILPIANGGTGVSTTPTNGQLLIGNGTGYTVANLSEGTGIDIANAAGSITVTNSGVTSITGTANQVIASGATGDVTLSTPQDIATTSTPSFASMTLSAVTNQLTLGTTNTTTISSVAPSASRVYTIPDFGSNDTFVGLSATQTLSNKSLSDATSFIVDSVDPTKRLAFDATNIGASTTLTLGVPTAPGTSDTLCLATKANCAGTAAAIGGSGTANTLTKFTGTYTIGDASITDTGSLVTLTTDVDFTLAGTENIALTNTSAASDQLALNVTGVTADGADAFAIAFTQADDGDATDTNSALNIAVTSSSGDADNLYAINIANITAGTASETALNIGTGWDTAINAGGTAISLAELQILDSNINLASEVTGTLPVGNGGTGATTLTLNGVLYGNATSAIGATTAGTNGQLLLGVTSGAPAFATMSSDATITNAGVLTISADAVALSTDTTGVYVGDVTSGSGISVSGVPAENYTETVSLGSLTANWSQTGAYDIVLNNAGSELQILSADATANFGILDVTTLTGDRTYTFPNETGTVCLSTNNCGFAGGTNYWQLGTQGIAPYNTTLDLFVGGTATASATFVVNALTGNVQLDGDLTVSGNDIFDAGSNTMLSGNGTGSIDAIAPLANGTLLDLSAITHSTTAVMGLKLPQNSTLLNGPSTGEGFMAYDTTIKKPYYWNGSAWVDFSGASTTLQESYNNDANGSDTIIALTSNDDSLIFRNPASAGTDSGYVLFLDQLNTGALDTLRLSNAGTGSELAFTSTTPNVAVADTGTLTFTDGTNTLLTLADNSNAGDVTSTGDIQVGGGDLTTDETTFNLINATATTLNIGGAATTAFNIGAGTGAFTAINLGTGNGGNGINIGSGSGSNTIAIGGGTGTIAFNSGDWDIGTTGDMTGIGSITMDGRLDTAAHANNTGLNFPTFAGAPSAVTGTVEGDVVYNTTGDTLYVYDGAAFTQIGGGGYSGWTLSDGSTTAAIGSGEQVNFTGGDGITTTATDATPNILDLDFNSTELNALTWGDSSQASNVWTYALSGSNDPTLTFADGMISTSHDLTITGGDIVGANSAQIDLGEAVSGDIQLYANGDTSDYLFLNTATDLPSLMWETGMTTNDAGVRLSASDDTGQLQYRDQNSATWVNFDDFGLASSDYWQLGTQGIAPYNLTLDTYFGGTATASAQLRIAGIETTGGNILDINSDTITTGTVADINSSSLISGELLKLSTTGNTFTTGQLLEVSSTATSLTSGNLGLFDWSPSSWATASGDLVKINIGQYGDLTGNLFGIYDNGSPLFTISPSQVTDYLPTQFTAAGDVSFSYDINMTNQTSSQLESLGPYSIVVGESFESNDLTLKTYNAGDVVINPSGSTSGYAIISDADPTLIFDTATATDTDFWVGVVEDAGSDDDDYFRIGDGTTPGSNVFLTIDTNGLVGIGTSSPISRLHVATNTTTLTGKAAAIFDQLESQDILTASASGTTRFTISNGGDINFSGGDITGANSAVIDLGESSTNGTGMIDLYANGDISDYLYANTASDLPSLMWETGMTTNDAGVRLSASDDTGQLQYRDQNNATWVNFDDFGLASSDYWQLGTQGIAPYNLTLDVYFGGVATASAQAR